jgi:hypothetical protein
VTTSWMWPLILLPNGGASAWFFRRGSSGCRNPSRRTADFR